MSTPPLKKLTEPLTLFLIGVTGDLAKKKILKAIYKLHEKQLLASPFTLIGNARSPLSREEFQAYVKEIVRPSDDGTWTSFAKSLQYVAGDAAAEATFAKIKTLHQKLQKQRTCGNHMWYIATLPQLYLPIIQNLKQCQLHNSSCGWTKLLIEKPFGTDLASAQKLNQELSEAFSEDQIYRIDHFLGKETVQNLVAFRFANGMFEELWSNKHIDHVQVTHSETLGVAGREQFYDATGATRDVVQNHLLQMIAVCLMEEPASLNPDDIRKSRSALLKSLTGLSGKNMADHVRFGQFTAGVIDGQKVPGYLEHEGIPAESNTETAVALKLGIDSPRWAGVPIYVRTGKRLARDVLELSVQFKDKPNRMFSSIKYGPDPNILTFRFQPNEGIVLRLFVKKPGHGIELDMVPMEFCYRNTYQMDFIEAYERLIHDASNSDATLFPGHESIESSWRIIDDVLDYQRRVKPDPYPAGSWGPESFTKLIEQDGREWIEPSIDVCSV